MKVFVIGNDKSENSGPIKAALQASGHELVNDVCSLTGAVDRLLAQHPRPEVVVVRADVVPRDRELEMLSLLADWPVVVLVPPSRLKRQAALEEARRSTATHVRGVLSVPPFDFSPLAQWCAGPGPIASAAIVTASPSVQTSTPSVALPAGRRQVRLGFYGSRGGTGVSTAALKVAQALAARGQRVALFDTTGRGDLQVMLGHAPGPQPLVLDALHVWLGQPTEEAIGGFEAVIIDGGRRKGSFNAEWIEVKKPLNDQALAQWAGAEAVATPRALSLGSLLSIEVTD
jgi:hypothetical protein